MQENVDKVVIKVESNKASLAESMIKGMKESGSLGTKKHFSLEEIVEAMLKDEPESLRVFQKEILGK